MNECAVINASPLIFLSRGRHLDILRHFFDNVYVPEAVANEIRRKGSGDITVESLDSATWIIILPTVPVPSMVLEWGLGLGEFRFQSVLTSKTRKKFNFIFTSDTHVFPSWDR